MRVSAQLADALTGAQRWAERYDRQIEDVFALQDEVARTIVAMLAAHVNRAEIERAINKAPETWQAYDYYLRAVDAYDSYASSLRAADLYEGRRLLEQSLAIEPNYARAYARLAMTHMAAYLIALDDDHLNPAALDQLHPNLPEAHAALGRALGLRREHEAAVDEFEKAMVLNPNFTDWRFSEILVWTGDPARAIEAAERDMRLDPFYYHQRLQRWGSPTICSSSIRRRYPSCENVFPRRRIGVPAASGSPRLTPNWETSNRPGQRPPRFSGSSLNIRLRAHRRD